MRDWCLLQLEGLGLTCSVRSARMSLSDALRFVGTKSPEDGKLVKPTPRVGILFLQGCTLCALSASYWRVARSKLYMIMVFRDDCKE